MRVTQELLARIKARQPDDASLVKEVKALVPAWIELASAGIVMVSGNRKLREQDDLESFWSTTGLNVIKTVLATRARFQKASKSIHKICERLCAGGGAGGFQPLAELQVPSAFESELATDAFDDLVSFRAAGLKTALQEAVGTFKEAARTHIESRDGGEGGSFNDLVKGCALYWAREISSETLDAALHEWGDDFYRIVPGKKSKSFADQIFVEDSSATPLQN